MTDREFNILTDCRRLTGAWIPNNLGWRATVADDLYKRKLIAVLRREHAGVKGKDRTCYRITPDGRQAIIDHLYGG